MFLSYGVLFLPLGALPTQLTSQRPAGPQPPLFLGILAIYLGSNSALLIPCDHCHATVGTLVSQDGVQERRALHHPHQSGRQQGRAPHTGIHGAASYCQDRGEER